MASTCPDFGIGDTAERDSVCAELNDILIAPYNAERAGDRSDEGSDLNEILRSFGELSEAYRSDPVRTLDLIKRIKAAGGLTE